MTHISNIATNGLLILWHAPHFSIKPPVHTWEMRPSVLHLGQTLGGRQYLTWYFGKRGNCSQADRSSQRETAETIIPGEVLAATSL